LDPHVNKTGDIWHISIEVPDIYPFMDFSWNCCYIVYNLFKKYNTCAIIEHLS
jgi:hypothetical protein